mmetsp:Transcript_127180/g.406958  ORF Transcript_127180/g.406958 Transcript_127180/m.406958 type:complete len:294 (-) Transcript_127180:681-1562(-)
MYTQAQEQARERSMSPEQGQGSLSRSTSKAGNAEVAPRSCAEVLRENGGDLTLFESTEIMRFPEIWFFGAGADKLEGDPSEASSSTCHCFDNEKGDYKIVLDDHLQYRYRILRLLGKGVFGQVVKAMDCKTKDRVAVKVVRNKAFSQTDALAEAKLLEHILRADPDDRAHVVHMADHFEFRGHLCLVFELLSIDLAKVLQHTLPHGLLPKLTHRFACQILKALAFLNRQRIVHRDLKPDNVMLRDSWGGCVKVVDFGSSCFEREGLHHSTYVQSRFYRAPEVILGIPYGGRVP